MRNHAVIFGAGAALLAVPFVLLTLGYAALPDQFPIMRSWDGSPRLQAAKSPVTVYRVPVIGVVTAAATAWMARRGGAGVSGGDLLARRFWLVLFVTACSKSAFEGVELAAGVVPEWWRAMAGWGMIAVVAVGLLAAAVLAPRAWPVFRQRAYWRLSAADWLVLAALAVAYVGFAIVPIVLAQRSRLSG
jgi:hypothetical protein